MKIEIIGALALAVIASTVTVAPHEARAGACAG
jgi:hypothetical protein